MNDSLDNRTTCASQDAESRVAPALAKNLAAAIFFVRLAAASTIGAQRCFLEDSASTQIVAGTSAESSTQLREMTLEIRAKIEAMLDAAANDIIEDGMHNAINDRLGPLIAKDFRDVIPALLSLIEGGRAVPIVASEVLKELGKLRDAPSHQSRRWTLERALGLSSPFIRDGAGLGLARLGDPDSLPYLRQAAKDEPNAQTRADLELVIDELDGMMADGAPATDGH